MSVPYERFAKYRILSLTIKDALGASSAVKVMGQRDTQNS